MYNLAQLPDCSRFNGVREAVSFKLIPYSVFPIIYDCELSNCRKLMLAVNHNSLRHEG